jgi:hypothetical protein
MSGKLIAAVVAALLGLAGAAHSQVDTSSYPRPNNPTGSLLDNVQQWQGVEMQRQQIEMQRLQLQQQRLQMQQQEQSEMQRQLEFERQHAEEFRNRRSR